TLRRAASGRQAPVGWPVLLFAMVLPTAITLLHIVVLSGGGPGNVLQQLAYIGGTVLQFGLPVVTVRDLEGRWPNLGRPSGKGIEFGLQFGLAVAAGMLALYFGLLRGTPLFTRTAAQLSIKLTEFGIAQPLGFALFAVFLMVVHSLLEEYYWRWFVFGRLRR